MTSSRTSSGQAFETYRDKSHFGGLDGMRFFAIAAVFFHHSPLVGIGTGVSPLSLRGFLGVDLFFVISGFLITTLLLRERDRKGRISLRGFYWRRVLRILPLYLLLVTAVGVYYALIKQAPGAAGIWPFYYLLMMNFLNDHLPTLAPTWSLGVEEQYYLIWPLLLVLLPRRALLAVIAGFVLVYAVLMELPVGHVQRDIGPLGFSLVRAFYPAMLIGSGLALLLARRNSFGWLWPVLGGRWSAPAFAVALIVALHALPINLHGFPNLAVHLIMAGLIGSVVIREDHALMPVLRFAPIRRIGVVSYGIYLLHLIALHVATGIMTRLFGAPEASMTLYLLLYAALSWLMAELSFRFYETPFLALRHKPLGFVPRDPATASASKERLRP